MRTFAENLTLPKSYISVSKTKSIHYRNWMGGFVAFIWVLFGFNNALVAQYSFGVETCYVTGFNDQPLQFMDEQVSVSMPHGAQVSVFFVSHIKNTEWLFKTGVGGKYLHLTGNSSSNLSYSANSFRVNGSICANRKFNDALSIGVHFVFENNRDFDDLVYLKSNLFRYYAGLEGMYQLNQKCSVVLKYWRVLSSSPDVYLLYNPANQVSIGLNYHFNEI